MNKSFARPFHGPGMCSPWILKLLAALIKIGTLAFALAIFLTTEHCYYSYTITTSNNFTLLQLWTEMHAAKIINLIIIISFLISFAAI